MRSPGHPAKSSKGNNILHTLQDTALAVTGLQQRIVGNRKRSTVVLSAVFEARCW